MSPPVRILSHACSRGGKSIAGQILSNQMSHYPQPLAFIRDDVRCNWYHGKTRISQFLLQSIVLKQFSPASYLPHEINNNSKYYPRCRSIQLGRHRFRLGRPTQLWSSLVFFNLSKIIEKQETLVAPLVKYQMIRQVLIALSIICYKNQTF